ncbi:unnamed protein product [Ceratitis capitata]|uniref:(Mediterranean fruit fly) hypothetical protein n=1 Tax=Ceratitis capitata TaxID=7213 RepID=A0A811VCY1_CERCA|nr:unnamed protein product [Ceratitis capitata]
MYLTALAHLQSNQQRTATLSAFALPTITLAKVKLNRLAATAVNISQHMKLLLTFGVAAVSATQLKLNINIFQTVFSLHFFFNIFFLIFLKAYVLPLLASFPASLPFCLMHYVASS